MRRNMFFRAVLLALACFTALSNFSIVAYADGRDGRYHHRKFYKHHRYYPRDYFFRKKVYFYPKKRYYYYYDYYPNKIYYYWGEKDVGGVNPNYLSLTNIANMVSQGIPDAVIIAEIERTRSVYKLNTEIITYLKQNGASDELIDYMMKTGGK